MSGISVTIQGGAGISASVTTKQVALPATVENSDTSYSDTVNAGDTLVIPDITITKNDDSTTTSPAAIDLDLRIIDPLPFTLEDLKNVNRDVVNWREASAPNVLNGTDLSHYIDQSGDGNHFTQATPSAQPAFTGSDETSLITFDGVAEFLEQPVNSGNFQNLTRFEWWGVVSVDQVNSQRIFHFNKEGVSLNDGCFGFLNADGKLQIQTNDDSASADRIKTDSALSVGNHICGFIWTGSNFKLVVDNVEPAQSVDAGSDTGTFIGGLVNKTNVDILTIGVLIITSSFYSPNKERFSLCFGGTTDAALSTAQEKTNIFNYINDVFNLGL